MNDSTNLCIWQQVKTHFDNGQWAQGLSLLEQQPARVEVLVARSVAWSHLGEHGKSGRDATAALQLQPGHKEALLLQANAFVKVEQPALALAAFTQLERLAPGAPFVACLRVFLARRLAWWQVQALPHTAPERQALQAQGLISPAGPVAGMELALLRHRALRGLPALEPFAALNLYDDPALLQHAARAWLRQWPAQAAGAAAQRTREKGPVRVAYLSSDFYNHATAWLLAGVLAQHSAESVKVWLISYSLPTDDDMARRLKTMGHGWVDARTWPDAQVAQYCREQGVQIAVDLKGPTQNGRTGIFAHRAAPVQVNWLGYPGTLPAPYYDYILADRVVRAAP